MTDVLKGRPVSFFDFPDDITEIRIDPVRGNRVAGNKGVAARFRKTEIPQ